MKTNYLSNNSAKIQMTLTFVFALFLFVSTTNAAEIPIVTNSTVHADIVVDAGSSSQVSDAANLLSDYIQQSTGQTLTVQSSSSGSLTHIHVGNTDYVNNLSLDTSGVAADGFIISAPDSGNIIIVGASDRGTIYGVNEFLERYVGIRWLTPGTVGEYIPSQSNLSPDIVSSLQWIQPAFVFRRFSGLTGEESDWAEHNKYSRTPWVRFHHNLYRLFPPSLYTDTHPEFFPIHDGTRYLPAAGVAEGWQPCFLADGIVDEAVNIITQYFAANPSEEFYSLGVNDLGGHCECSECLARVNGKLNSIGLPDYSDIYFEWCNAVATGVLAEYPDKRLGLLAYSEVHDPPSFPLDASIVTFLTQERLKWADSNIENTGHLLTQNWSNKTYTLGWYDYIYGDVDRPQHDHYLVPRVWFHKMAEYYKFGYENDVRYLYAEAYPHDDWRDGPKLYLSSKLQWNPYLDVDALLNEWYEKTVGLSAASDLATFYAFWEDYWTNKIPQSSWFKKGYKLQYLNFNAKEYLVPLSEADLDYCEGLLNAVVTNAGTTKEQAHAQNLRDSFSGWKAQILPIISTMTFKFSNDPAYMISLIQSVSNVFEDHFNYSDDGWFFWQRATSHATPGYDASTAALKINMQGAEGTPVVYLKDIPVRQGQLYRMSSLYKSSGLTEGASLDLAIKWKNSAGSWLDNGESQYSYVGTINNGNWQEMEVFFEPPDNAASVVLMLTAEHAYSGYVWFDDITFDKIVLGTIPTNIPPTCSITSPLYGATYSGGDDVTISANASDNYDGSITNVEFYEDSTKLGEDNSPPYSFTWTNVSAGSYNLTAVATDDSSATTTSKAVSITVHTPTHLVPHPDNGAQAQLSNSPNPFSHVTRITYDLHTEQQIQVDIYDAFGGFVTELANERQQAGRHQVTFDACNLPSGIYICRIKTGSRTLVHKMLLLKSLR